ncbi:CDP-glycerol--glycerophosphate glycerophosphotransferase, partial [Campylobacter jejuni]|nr:CDP-glycerol--glycerophosphate glycerophosphotransferase [Campylobacter jejuni]ECQ6985967.1 CDP-glycerol--glycerophosphate glycerophosphotransferase [Campylobacter jejuni]
YKIILNNKSINNIKSIASSSVIIIDQSNYFLSHIKLFSSTKVIQLWHGGGLYKKVAFDKTNYFKKNARIHRNISFLNISDEKLTKEYSRMFNVGKKNIISYGLPRTDLLFKRNSVEDKKKFFLLYPQINGKKICLYAPTFRENKHFKRNLKCFDIEKINKQLEDYVIIYRSHPTLKYNNNNIINVSDLELDFVLSISDILISDYSSIIFDYSFFRRPIVLFVPDLEEYFVQKKQLYYHPCELVGDENVCYKQEELIKFIKQAVYKIDLWKSFMANCRGNSCQEVVKFIISLQNKD